MRPTTERAAQVEYDLLTSEAGQSLLREVAAVAAPGPTDLERWRRLASVEDVAAAIRLVDGRRRGAAKFSRAERMWFEPTAPPAEHGRARRPAQGPRFAGAVVVDLCCGIGGDALALASEARRRGGRRSRPWACSGEPSGTPGLTSVADRLFAVRARAETFRSFRRASLVHVDPDRRARRAVARAAVSDYAPGSRLSSESLLDRVPGGAIKLGPASDFAERVRRLADRKSNSSASTANARRRPSGSASLAGCRRRATALPSGATWTDRDGPAGTAPIGPIGAMGSRARPGPDPVGAARRLRPGACERRRFLAGVDLLSGPDRLDSGLVANFAVERVLPLDLKIVRARDEVLSI